MTLFQSIILGIVQGLTEFLPISSSGHLVLFQNLFGMKEPMLAFDIAVHGGTLVAVLAFFYKDILVIVKDLAGDLRKAVASKDVPRAGVLPQHQGLWACILITLVPTGIIAVFFRSWIETAFSKLVFVAIAWLAMGALLILSQRFSKGQKDLSAIHYGDALWVGLAQGIALLPGVSRSGSTILAGMLLGIKKEDAAKFSFLISIPAILAAIIMDLKESIQYFSSQTTIVLAGFFAAAVTGYLVIRWLMRIIQRGHFFLFGYYCIAAGLFALTLTILS
ncbi:MAG TPA: undecaprenyl-diphosphatase UppP [Candidatus Omnitrophota bacterium]|nr:undecaprenyl-diphosphatase UppP [Candidatus Omnitrophota bacterium]